MTPTDRYRYRGRWRILTMPLVVALGAGAACGGSDDADDAANSTTSAPASAAADQWREEATAMCDHFVAGISSIPDHDGTPPSLVEFTEAHRQVRDSAPALPDGPDDAAVEPDRVATLVDEADATLTAAHDAAAAGDTTAAVDAIDQYFDRLGGIAGAMAINGASCADADPARAEHAALNVLLEQEPWQLATGFDSIWVSELSADRVVRIDPEDGTVLATIDVGAEPFKLQPADGHMWVRTADAYLAIDPQTDTITATLAKPDVGPAANRSYVVDGAMWICDGQRLHRYDPTTLQPTTAIDLRHDCGQVYATTDLAVAWNYNEDQGESGASAATIVDAATNQVLATIDLPVDVGVPVVLDDAVFLPGWGGATAVVVDRATWTVTATPELGRVTAGSQPVADGASIYLPAAVPFEPPDVIRDVLVIDASTFAVTDTIETLGVNAVAVDRGALWVTQGDFNVLQRFDLAQ